MTTPLPLGRYTLSPLAAPDKHGTCRWRLTGPGVRFDFRPLSPEQADLAGRAFLEHAGIDAGPVRWSVTRPAPQAPARESAPTIAHKDPLPAWATLKPDPTPGACIIIDCLRAIYARGLCHSHDNSARRSGIRDRLGPLAMSRQEAAARGCCCVGGLRGRWRVSIPADRPASEG